MTPKVSIIVPVYNVEAYLNDCIESILAQTYTDFEVILIDDGSTDKSSEICDCYSLQDYRIKVYHTENRGVSSARSYGVLKSCGNYISFIDSDDFVPSNAIYDLYEYSIKYDLDISIGGFNICDDNNSKYIPISNEIINQEEYIKRLLLQKTNTGPCGKLYKKRLFKESSFFHLVKGEDYLMNLEIASRIKSVGYLNISVYNYYQRQSSVIHQHKTNLLYEKNFNNYAKNILLNNNMFHKYEREYLSFSLNQIYTLYLYRCDFDIKDYWIKNIISISHIYKLTYKEAITVKAINFKLIRSLIYITRKLYYKYVFYHI